MTPLGIASANHQAYACAVKQFEGDNFVRRQNGPVRDFMTAVRTRYEVLVSTDLITLERGYGK